MRIALYCRCSTSDQTTDLQLEALRDYSQARRFKVVEEYVDEGISGAKAKRPALDRLLHDAHRRRFDVLLVWKLDRLGRSLSHLIRVVDTLGSLGVDLVSLGDPGLDTTSPHGKLIFSIMGAVAEFERDLIRERTRAGMQAAKRRGKRIGRPRAQISISRARTLLDEGHSISAVARTLSVSRATLQRWLKRVPTEAPLTP
jgi:DNA invertase Pin-like site-specific DNA recombinase